MLPKPVMNDHEVRLHALELLEKLQSALSPLQADVHQGHVQRVARRGRGGALVVRGAVDRETLPAEQVFQAVADAFLVVHNEDGRSRHAAPPARPGRLREIRVPWCILLFTSMAPLYFVTIP
jgi:hypothetical protein